jgi:hypothetical protein
MKTALAFAFAFLPLAAFASYPVEVDSEMNGLKITVLTSSGVPLVVTFKSEEKADATCRAGIASGLDTPQERTVTVKAGKSTAIPFKIVSTPNRVRVKATCEPAPVKSGK